MSPKHLANPLHGILLIVLFSFSAFYIADFEWVKHLSLSPLIVGIVLGMLYANSLRNHLPETWVPGIQFCTKQVLRTGIVLYGFKLTFQSVIDIGGSALALDLIVVTLTILLGAGLGRLLKMDRDTALLTSIGSSICGAAAVLAERPGNRLAFGYRNMVEQPQVAGGCPGGDLGCEAPGIDDPGGLEGLGECGGQAGGRVQDALDRWTGRFGVGVVAHRRDRPEGSQLVPGQHMSALGAVDPPQHGPDAEDVPGLADEDRGRSPRHLGQVHHRPRPVTSSATGCGSPPPAR